MKNRIVRFVKTYPGTKLMALFLACVVWFYIYQEYTEKLPPMELPIKLSLPVGITARIENLEGEPITSLRVTLAGPRGSLKIPDNLVCRHKIALAGPIKKSLVLEREIAEADFDLPRSVYIKEVVPDKIRVILFQEIAKRMRIKTTDCWQGNPARGYTVVNVKTEPSDILVKGPKDILGKYNEVPMAKIDVSGRQGPFSQVGLIQDMLNGEKITTNESFSVMVDIQPEPVLKVLRSKINTLVLPDFPYKVAITPPEIEVKLQGSQESINKLKESHLNLFINVADLYTDPAELKPPMSFTADVRYTLTADAPPGIQLAEPLPQIKLDVLKPPEGTLPQ